MLSKKGLLAKPVTLGQHLRNKRLKLGLKQEEVAARLNTIREVYERWERDERDPVISEWPTLLKFLGYYPFEGDTAADLVLRARRSQGMDQKAMAALIGTFHQRFRRWEHGREIVPQGIAYELRILADKGSFKEQRITDG